MASTRSYVLVLLSMLFAQSLVCSATEGLQNSETPRLSTVPCDVGPLGMESGEIPDSSLTASSTYGSSYRPPAARLNVGSQGWIPRPPENQWFQVDLGTYTAVTGIIIQGHPTSPSHGITAFSIQYSNTGGSDDWSDLTDAEGDRIQFNGNAPGIPPVTVTFPIVVMGRYIRILPTAWTTPTFRLNFELLGCRDNLVRLVGGEGALSGRVELFKRGEWGVVCDLDWDFKDASVVCRQLGFLEAEEARTGSSFGDSSLPMHSSRVACKGSETHLAQCPSLCRVPPQCNQTSTAGVVCKENTIRLVGGSNHTSGRVEVHSDGYWGTVCDHDWDLTDAAVACRQLGFAGAQRATTGARFGQGRGAVLMDGVACQGGEARLTDCPSLCWETPRCNHTQDAGVVCLKGNDTPRSDIEQETIFPQ